MFAPDFCDTCVAETAATLPSHSNTFATTKTAQRTRWVASACCLQAVIEANGNRPRQIKGFVDLADLSSFRRDDRFKKETVFYIVVGDREMELRAPNSKEVDGWVSELS